MDACIIIGFNYSSKFNDKFRGYLKGIIVDLYTCYTYTKKLVNKENMVIITDITINYSAQELKEIVMEDSVDVEIFNFVNDIIENQVLHIYSSKKDLIDIIENRLKGKERILFYYTGHSYDAKILLPILNNHYCYIYNSTPDTILDLYELKEIICNNSNLDAEIFMILDCCNSNGLGLPYKLTDEVYRLNYYPDTLFKSTHFKRHYTLQKIICFSSTYIDENAIALKCGSIFTITLFKNIKTHRKINNLLTIISTECLKKFEQSANVSSSYPNLKLIWRWLIVNDDVKFEIDHLKNFFIKKI